MNGKHDNVWDEMLRESEEIEASQVAETGAAENRLAGADMAVDEPEYTATKIDSTPTKKPVQAGVSNSPKHS